MTDSTEIWPVNLPPTPQQTRKVLAVTIALVVGLAVSAPFANKNLPRINSFIPAVESAVILTDLITALFLFSQSRIYHSRALLALASGYLFTALIVVPHLLTFPGAFAPTGLLGAGLQTTGWLYVFWHFGFSTAMLAYALLKDEEIKESGTRTWNPSAVGWSAALVIGLICGLTLLATWGEPFLPHLFLDLTHIGPLSHYILALNLLLCVVAFALLWSRQRSILDQWLMVVNLALTSELVSNGLLITARFTLGWYVSRIFAIATSAIVLVVLIEETVRVHGMLARSNAMLVRERNSKLMNLDALAASIAHEVKQPLTVVTLNGAALLQFLKQSPPKLEKARSSAERIIVAGHHIGEILDNVRNLFGKPKREPSPVDMNDLTLETLHILDQELKDHRVAIGIQLTPELPPVMGHRGQLREVIANVIQNAIEAMEGVDNEDRTLHVKTERYGGNAISVTIVDAGPGIDPMKSHEIFETFFTTKSHGMGLGLAICRMIVERHGGQISVSPVSPHGAAFEMILPQMGPS